MRKKLEIKQEDLNGLFGYFSSDAEEAGKKYTDIRDGLIRYFTWRGAVDVEYLADETISRVAAKVALIEPDEKFDLKAYFYSFAANVYLEEVRERKRLVYDYEGLETIAVENEYEKNEPGAVCLEKCLSEHSQRERSLIVQYYGFERNERAEERRKLAVELEVNMTQLHTRVSRIKKILRDCVLNCLNGKN